MKEQLISFETAKLAKEKGFIVPVKDCYNENEEIEDNEFSVLINYNMYPLIQGSNKINNLE